MARIAKQTEYNARTVAGLLTRWQAIPVAQTNIRADKPALDFAVPVSAAEFTPNAHLMYLLLRALSGSIRQHFADSGANYNSYMSMYSRWKKDAQDFLDYQAEIAGYPDKHMQSVERASEHYIKTRDDLYKSVEGWVSYEAWLRILGKSRVLSAPVIAAIPRSMPVVRERLQRMYREWVELGGLAEEAASVSVAEPLPTVGIKLGSRGDVSISKESLDAVGNVPAMSGAALDKLLVPGEGNRSSDVFIGHIIEGEVTEAVAGCVFVNTIFRDVIFRGAMTGATFIACDFEGECRIMHGVDASEMTFKNCVTRDGVLGLANVTLTGLRMFQCGEMKLNVKRSGITNSHITDGWIDCGRLPEDRDNDAAERIAPRTVNNATWQNGGLDFDMRNVPYSETSGNAGLSMVLTLVPAATRVTLVHNPINPAIVDSCGDIAEGLLLDHFWSTKQLALTKWQVADQDEELLRIEEAQRRKQARRGAAVAPVAVEETPRMDADSLADELFKNM